MIKLKKLLFRRYSKKDQFCFYYVNTVDFAGLARCFRKNLAVLFTALLLVLQAQLLFT